jgi:para-aminobenzoate synthetase component 1
VREIEYTADELVTALLRLSETETVCLLDSCGVGHLGSHLAVGGIEPVEVREITNADPAETLAVLDKKVNGKYASVFTISYDFGLKLLNVKPRTKEIASPPEPDVFLALFDALIVHDYDTGQTILRGNPDRFDLIQEKLRSEICNVKSEISAELASVTSNFTKAKYLTAIETIKERIRCGDTYQTNLTQQLTVKLPASVTAAGVFHRLRKNHPAPFASFIKRAHSTVISASPERFFRVSSPRVSKGSPRRIETSPIKGTRPRGQTPADDDRLRSGLLSSPKDRAENTMIVDLLRNDFGRVCEYGTVRVEKLCDLEEHPTLFHLVSTIAGDLRRDASVSDILRAVFPCGSITGAPKLSTMRIIDELETVNRGLSMGAIGYSIPNENFGLAPVIDLSVAIRTMAIRDDAATLNVGGGIVIDSDPEKEYDETLLKARALLSAIGAKYREHSSDSGV